MAGGYTRIAEPSNISVKRIENGVESVVKLNAKRMARGGASAAFKILPGDIITVPESFFRNRAQRDVRKVSYRLSVISYPVCLLRQPFCPTQGRAILFALTFDRPYSQPLLCFPARFAPNPPLITDSDD